MSEDRILTKHPSGKLGVNILKRRYDVIASFILTTLKEREEISYDKLSDLAITKLSATFDGKVVWYIVTVKLDLEARNLIERIPKASPHRLLLKT